MPIPYWEQCQSCLTCVQNAYTRICCCLVHEELRGVLWAYCTTTVRTPICETPFTLTYGHKVVALVEVEMPNYRIQHFDQDSNGARLEDFLEERRLEVEVRTTIKKRFRA